MITIFTNIFFDNTITIIITIFVYIINLHIIRVLTIGVCIISTFHTSFLNTITITQTNETGNNGFNTGS